MHRVFRAVAATVVPEAAQLDAAGWAEVEKIVERALADRPVALRRKLMAFLGVVEWMPLLRYGRRFSTLDSARRERLLSAFERAPLLLIRRGFWGVRTLVFMGYYGRPAAAAVIGYRADPRGWEARR
ncbi:MAG TPA: gluconate 2-dehydrogenase subunit 3 family protein [Gemmatimonadales bacterium]|nr:gluconate 2-dehydrogenase subunit 3 family protein [Gemmatimonadales bacterium]